MLLSKYKVLASPPALNPKPPAVSQGGETQTRAQRALSTPQPLNTFSALPFENKPRRQAPSQTLAACKHTCLFGDFPAAVPGSRCEDGGNQAWRFTGQCGDHDSHSAGEVRCGASPAVGQSWLRWRHVISAISTACGFILSNLTSTSWKQIAAPTWQMNWC